jgi:hypothetical protein
MNVWVRNDGANRVDALKLTIHQKPRGIKEKIAPPAEKISALLRI